MKYSRIWAMPDKWTFKIAPIARLVQKYVGNGSGWIDPFAGENSPAEITNDLNPIRKSMFKMDALDFLQTLPDGVFNGCLFDPPYSPRQIKECYEEVGIENSFENTQSTFWSKKKDVAATKIKHGGLAICFGWNTTGFGLERGFELIEIMLVCHGGAHNDTIITVERKFRSELSFAPPTTTP